MGAFLAALGAVLLFILRVIGILLLVVLILLVLLLLCPFCADLCWEHGVLTVKAGALGITFPVFQYPKPEPPPAPENPEPPRGLGKSRQGLPHGGPSASGKRQRESPQKGRRRCRQGKQARPAAQKGKDHAGDPLHHAQRCGHFDQSCVRCAAHHKNTGAPWRARGGPRRRCPQLRQAAGVAVPVLGVLDRFLWLQFDELRILPDFGSGQPTVEDRVSCRVSAQALFIVLAAVRVLYEFWRKKVLDIFL